MNSKVKTRDIEWHQASSEILKVLRGKRSQLAFSRRLGYAGRPVADWEAGRRFPTASTFFRACSLSGIDVTGALRRFHPASASAFGSGSDEEVAAWLRELQAGITIIDISRRSGQPRFSVSRWLAGQSRPRLPQLLQLLEALTSRVSDLVAELVEIENISALISVHQRRCASRNLAFEEPWSAAILRVIETRAYRSQPHLQGWIAERIGIEVEVEERCLSSLKEAGMVDWTADSRRYTTTPMTVDTHSSPEQMRRLKAHWVGVALDRLTTGTDSPDDVFSFNVVSASAKDIRKIRQILSSSYREIRSLVAASSPIEEVALVQMQLVTMKEN